MQNGEPQSFFQTTLSYWENQDPGDPSMWGVPGVGGAGPVEIPYRHREELRHFLRLIQPSKTMSILELGCGTGRWMESLAPKVSYYEAVDFSKQMLQAARRRAESAGLQNIATVNASAQDYVPTKMFDVIYLSGVTQFLEDDEIRQIVGRLLKHLNPGGVMLDRTTVRFDKREVVGNRESDGYASIYRTAPELISLFEASGLQNLYRNPSYTFLNFPQRIQDFLWRPATVKFAAAWEPLSLHALRVGAIVSKAVFGPVGEMTIYTHDFFLYKLRHK